MVLVVVPKKPRDSEAFVWQSALDFTVQSHLEVLMGDFVLVFQ